jgi:hypothetical protein
MKRKQTAHGFALMLILLLQFGVVISMIVIAILFEIGALP